MADTMHKGGIRNYRFGGLHLNCLDLGMKYGFFVKFRFNDTNLARKPYFNYFKHQKALVWGYLWFRFNIEWWKKNETI